MNKSLLKQQILASLEVVHEAAINAAMVAYNTATHEENIAENKYDTLGLEAAYLAQGQARRVAECEADLLAYKNLPVRDFSAQTPIAQGALIGLENKAGKVDYLFLGPAAGGLKINYEGQEITIITRAAPLGGLLLGLVRGDEVEMEVAGHKRYFEVIEVS